MDPHDSVQFHSYEFEAGLLIFKDSSTYESMLVQLSSSTFSQSAMQQSYDFAQLHPARYMAKHSFKLPDWPTFRLTQFGKT